jgi:hypothetical protein
MLRLFLRLPPLADDFRVSAPMTRISVLLPAFNAEAYVVAAVESILAQTAGDFELLIIDDGSTDRTFRADLGARLQGCAASDSPADRTEASWQRSTSFSMVPMRPLSPAWMQMTSRRPIVRAPVARVRTRPRTARGRFRRVLDRFRRASVEDRFDAAQHLEIDRHTMAIVHGCGMCHPAMMFRREAFRAGREVPCRILASRGC